MPLSPGNSQTKSEFLTYLGTRAFMEMFHAHMGADKVRPVKVHTVVRI
jgi:hypothetical protein